MPTTTKTALDHRIAGAARTTDDVITRAVVYDLGGTDKDIQERLARKVWQKPFDGVYLTRCAKPTWRQHMRAAVAASGGGVASHRSAAALWDLDGAEEGAIEVTTQVGKGKVKGIVNHRTRRWEPDRFVTRHGIECTDIARTLCDYAQVVPRLMAERAVESALLKRHTTAAYLRREANRLDRPRVKGPRVILDILDGRPEGKPARSGFEVMLLDVCREYGLKTPTRNVTVRDADGVPFAEIDLMWEDEAVAVEAMGRFCHSTSAQRRRDQIKREKLEQLGVHVEEVYWEHVVHGAPALAERIADLLRARASRKRVLRRAASHPAGELQALRA